MILIAAGVATWDVLLHYVDLVTLPIWLGATSGSVIAGGVLGYEVQPSQYRWWLWIGGILSGMSFALLITLGFLTWWPSVNLLAFGVGGWVRHRKTGAPSPIAPGPPL
jgi:hypothetical protein